MVMLLPRLLLTSAIGLIVLYITYSAPFHLGPGAAFASKRRTASSGGALREQLASLTNDPQALESRTLGFSKILTIGLDGNKRTRGVHMALLGETLDLDIELFSGTLSSSPVVAWILERVLADTLFREKHPEVTSSGFLYQMPSDRYEGLTWPKYVEKYSVPLNVAKFKRTGEFGTPDEVETQLASILKLGELDKWTPSGLRGMVACWHAHIRAAIWISKTPGINSALILEDDVDLEWDIKRLWAGMSRQLPSDWDAVYLGYVWSQEAAPTHQAPTFIRPSVAPLGGMAYALSKRGAEHILSCLRGGSIYHDGWARGIGPFGQPWDNAMRALISTGKISSYSVHPPPVFHPNLFSSNIGVGSNWNGTLLDSPIRRLCEVHDIESRLRPDEKTRRFGCYDSYKFWLAEPTNPFAQMTLKRVEGI